MTIGIRVQVLKVSVEMLKEVDEQVEAMKTSGRAKKASRSKDMLSALDGRVAKLEGPIGDVKETLKEVDGRTRELELRDNQLKDQMVEALSENMDVMQGVLNIAIGELIEKEDAPDAIVSTLKEHIEELKGELNICKVALCLEVEIVQWDDVHKGCRQLLSGEWSNTSMLKTSWTMLPRTWEEFHREFKVQFYLDYAKDEARVKLRQLTQQRKVREYVREFSELMLQISDLVESLFEFISRRNKFESFETREEGNGGRDEEGPVENNIDNGGNGKRANGKWKPNKKPKGPMRDDEQDRESVRLGLIVHFVDAKRMRKIQWSVSCVMVRIGCRTI
ncbi:hypothetical protein Gorai_022668 [Gossypium raimondii]|uniref:Retrotransposon gag domain-containing protein n=1 Tax=Gossypium raimondii TaxID=29730 RepID=A0A7J8NUN6_GOSRA|nr:hypothetical protein [Gossypium raimondii]